MLILRLTLALVGLTAASGIDAPAIQMEVQGGETRCLADSVRTGEDTTFKFRAVPMKEKQTDRIAVTVVHPDGELYNTELKTEPEEHLVQKSEGGGTYKVCFRSLQPKGTSARVELVETTVLPEHGPRPETAAHLRPVEVLLQHAKEVTKGLGEQLAEGASKENERIAADKVLRSRINMLASFTVFVLISVSAWQLVLLNKFFRSKKLI